MRRQGVLKEGSSAEFSPQNGVTQKRRCTATRHGRTSSHVGPEHLETVCGWIPTNPVSLKAASQGGWLEHPPSPHWCWAIASSWVNLVLLVMQVRDPSRAILFLSVARVLLHRTCVSALESSSGNHPDLPVPLLPPSLRCSGSVLCLEVSGRCSNK